MLYQWLIQTIEIHMKPKSPMRMQHTYLGSIHAINLYRNLIDTIMYIG